MYNFTMFHQNEMKNKKVLLITCFSVQNFKVSVESLKLYIVHSMFHGEMGWRQIGQGFSLFFCHIWWLFQSRVVHRRHVGKLWKIIKYGKILAKKFKKSLVPLAFKHIFLLIPGTHRSVATTKIRKFVQLGLFTSHGFPQQ